MQVEAARAGEQRAEAEATELQAQLDLQAVLNGQLVAQLQDGQAELSQVWELYKARCQLLVVSQQSTALHACPIVTERSKSAAAPPVGAGGGSCMLDQTAAVCAWQQTCS